MDNEDLPELIDYHPEDWIAPDTEAIPGNVLTLGVEDQANQNWLICPYNRVSNGWHEPDEHLHFSHEVQRWCDDNLLGRVSIIDLGVYPTKDNIRKHYYNIFFTDDKDYILFKMRWE